MLSLDALRGADMLLLMGLPALITAVVGGVMGYPDCWLIKTMRHVEWAGFNVMDTVFPLFMFVSGVSFPYSCAKRLERGDSRRRIVGKIVWRTLALVALGIVFNGFFSKVFTGGLAAPRYPSVLARIGIAWGAAAALYLFCGLKTRLSVALGILVSYWALVAFVPAPGAAPGVDTFSPDGCFVCWLDRHIWPNGWNDPEGLLSTFPAIVTTMGGVFAGEFVRSPRLSGHVKSALMLLVAALCGLLAWGCSPWCPIIKKLWTPTFVLAAWSYSLAWFAALYWIVDVLEWRKWTFFLKVIGMNSITIYFIRVLIDFKKPAAFFFHDFGQWLGAPWTAVVDAFGYTLVLWLVLLLFYKKNIFLRV